MLAWRPLTPSTRRHRHTPGHCGPQRPCAPPRAAAPHRPAPRCAPEKRGSLCSDSCCRFPSATAGGSRSRPTPPAGERAAGGTGLIPIPLPARYRHGDRWQCYPPAAPPGCCGHGSHSPPCAWGIMACPSPSPGERRAPPLPPAAGVKGQPGPLRSPGWASPPLPSLPPAASPRGASSSPAGTPAAVLT